MVDEGKGTGGRGGRKKNEERTGACVEKQEGGMEGRGNIRLRASCLHDKEKVKEKCVVLRECTVSVRQLRSENVIINEAYICL